MCYDQRPPHGLTDDERYDLAAWLGRVRKLLKKRCHVLTQDWDAWREYWRDGYSPEAAVEEHDSYERGEM